jgi:hypothetical protein
MTQAPLDPATAPAGTTSPGGETHEQDWAVLELEVLHDLARVGTAISEQLNQGYAATAAALPAGSPARVKADREVALAFMRLSRAVRLTMAMFGRVRQAREALAAGTASPVAPFMPQRPPAGASQRAVDAMVRRLEARTLDLDAEPNDFDDDDLDDEEDLFDDLYDGPDPADAPDRPDRESLTELADFGFSLKSCGPGEVIARIYRDLGLPPDPARWPQAWPAGVPGPGGAVAEASGPDGAPDRHTVPAPPSDPYPPDPRPNRRLRLSPRPIRPHRPARPCHRSGGTARPKTAADECAVDRLRSNARPPFQSSLPLREGAGGGVCARPRANANKDRLCRQDQIIRLQTGPGVENPLPLPPPARGRGKEETVGSIRKALACGNGHILGHPVFQILLMLPSDCLAGSGHAA